MSNMQLKIIKEKPVEKADISVQLSPDEIRNSGDWITPINDQIGLRNLVKNSAILPQCIRAYKNNIAGFGIGVRYIDDTPETPEMAAEFTKAQEIIELLNTEQDTKEVFENIIEAREIYGIAYLEIIRNMAGEPVQIEFIKDTPSIRKTKPLDPYIATVYYHHGKQTERRKRCCKYRQDIGGKTVYFKEFGDPRIMDNRTGNYIEKGETLELQYQANEILEFAIGTEPYGEVRWIGQVLGVDGSRKAEILNNNYFKNGRHTPLMIILRGGTLTDESTDKLRQYMDEIKGEAGQHAFIVLEAENADNAPVYEAAQQPQIEIKDLANILQKDELFQDYLDNSRRKVQSSFQLPDLYVGYTTDFNRATAQTAQEVTEKQTFQPERKSLAWKINNQLLNSYQFKYVEAYFLEPDISNPDDLTKILNICSNAGGISPNKAKQIAYEAMGEVSEDYNGEWGNIPLAYAKIAPPQLDNIALNLQKQIQKAAHNHDDEIIPVLKEIRDYFRMKDFSEPDVKKKNFLEKMLTSKRKPDIIKGSWNEEDHPRGYHGRFTNVDPNKKKAGGSSEENDKNSYSRKTLKLPKKEYAKVISEINTNYHSRYEGKKKGHLDLATKKGYFCYRFEIHGFDDYNIYDKEKY